MYCNYCGHVIEFVIKETDRFSLTSRLLLECGYRKLMCGIFREYIDHLMHL